MQRSYGRKGPSPFDRLVNEQCQKGVVGRWSGGSSAPLGSVAPSSSSSSSVVDGVSVRSSLGLLESSSVSESPPPPKKKKFFKSREEPRVLASNAPLPVPPSVEPPRQQHVAPESDSNSSSSSSSASSFYCPPYSTIPSGSPAAGGSSSQATTQKKKKFFLSKKSSPDDVNTSSGGSFSKSAPLKVPPLRLKLSASSHFKPYKEEEEEKIEEEPQDEEEEDTAIPLTGKTFNEEDEKEGTPASEGENEEDHTSKKEDPTSSWSPKGLPPSPPFVDGQHAASSAKEEEDSPLPSPTALDLTETEPLETPPPSTLPDTSHTLGCKVPDLSEPTRLPEDLPGNQRALDTKTKSLTISSIKEREETGLLSTVSNTTSKRSIFKSKAGSRKAKYNHKWNPCGLEDKEDVHLGKNSLSGTASSKMDDAYGLDNEFDEPFHGGNLVKVSKAIEGEDDEKITSIKCSKSQKSYFTVVKSVKKAHQIQDSGEFQEFNDDVDYILGGLGSELPLSTRCLSTITLASKCMESSFRMHLRAHGTATKFFTELRDSPEKASLGLCAATVLFVLSQDRLNMDLDKNSLELMLNLLDTDSRKQDSSSESEMDEREFVKNKEKVKDLCAAMKSKGHAKNLSLDHISADHLAMETLLSLTSKRAGEWFKEDLRELGGLDHLVRTLSECVNYLLADEVSIWTESLLSKLRKADRVLKVLENVTSENEDNCLYLLNYEESKCFNVVHSLLRLLSQALPSFPNNLHAEKDSVGYTLSEVLLDVIRVYINLVHDYHTNSVGSKKGGLSDLIDIILHCLFVLPNFVPINKSFDTSVLCLTLLINLVENCENNRKLMFLTRIPGETLSESGCTGVEGLVNLFIEKESSARHEESKTDNILDGVSEDKEEDTQKKSREEVIDETIAKLLQKAGRHMEDTLIASYITLIIGYTILDNKDHELSVRELLPNKNFVLMVSILKKFYNFMNLTASSTLASSRGIKATEKIIKYLQTIDKSEAEDKALGEHLDLKEGDHVNLAQVSNDKLSIMEDIKPAEDYDDDDFGSI